MGILFPDNLDVRVVGKYSLLFRESKYKLRFRNEVPKSIIYVSF